MLLDSVLFFALTATGTTLVMIALRLVRARLSVGLPFGLLALAAGGACTILLTHDNIGVEILVAVSVASAIAAKLTFRSWSFMAAEVFALLCLAGIAYFAYAAYLTVYLLLAYNAIWFLSSLVLLVFETAAIVLAISYAFEMLDVLGRRESPFEIPPLQHAWKVAIQVPTYNEPVEVVQPRLRRLPPWTTPTSRSRWLITTPPTRKCGGRSRRFASGSANASSSFTSRTGPGSRPGDQRGHPAAA